MSRPPDILTAVRPLSARVRCAFWIRCLRIALRISDIESNLRDRIHRRFEIAHEQLKERQ